MQILMIFGYMCKLNKRYDKITQNYLLFLYISFIGDI